MPRKEFPGKKTRRIRPDELRVTSVSPPEAGERVCLPLYLCRVPAGFPSPAGDYVESNIDLNEWLVGNRLATYIVRVEGDSMAAGFTRATGSSSTGRWSPGTGAWLSPVVLRELL